MLRLASLHLSPVRVFLGRITRPVLTLCVTFCVHPYASSASNPDTLKLFKEGQRYERSSHTETEFRRAYWAYCLAARHGHAEAAYNIAWMYLNGRGVPRDDQLAGHWLDVSARLGDPHSMHLADRLVLEAADDDPNCPRSVGRQRIDLVKFNETLARFTDTQSSPLMLKPVLSPPEPDQQTLIASRQAVETESPPEPSAGSSIETINTAAPPTSTPRPVETATVRTPEPPTQNTRPDTAKTMETALSSSRDATTQATNMRCPWTMAATIPKYRQRVIGWLKERGIHHSVESQRDRVNDYFVVMVHPHSNHDAAKKTAQALIENGHSALKIFASGPYQHAVSLGIFRQLQGAETLTNQLKNQGFGAVYKQMNFPPIIPLITSTLTDAQLSALRKQFPPLPIKQLDCPQRPNHSTDA